MASSTRAFCTAQIDWDLGDDPDVKGRLCAHFMARTRAVLVVSAYFHSGQSPHSEPNMALGQALVTKVKTWGGPYIICGDFNCTPGEVITTLWQQALEAVVFAPTFPICCTGRVLDY